MSATSKPSGPKTATEAASFPSHMQTYLVVFRKWDAHAGAGGRPEWVEHQSGATDAQINDLRAWIRLAGLEGQVAQIGKPTVFGSVAIIGTKELAARLRGLPFVDAVIPGS